MRAISSEDENLHAAWSYALHAGLTALLELTTDSLGNYYEWQGYLSEGEAAFRAAQAWAVRDDGPEHLRLLARLTAWYAVFCTFAADPDEAPDLFTYSLELLGTAAVQSEDVRAERAFALWCLGRLRALQGHSASITLFEQSLKLYLEIGRNWEASAVLGDLGEQQFERGHTEAASSALRCILPPAAAGRAERAAEIYALDAAMPLWQASQPLREYRYRLLAAIRAALPPETFAAALERGHDLER